MIDPVSIPYKICTACFVNKPIDQYYKCSGAWRGECKECTVKKNVAYQKRTKAWLGKYTDPEKRRQYHRDYYARNREKFAEYRKGFRERYPNYYEEYRNL